MKKTDLFYLVFFTIVMSGLFFLMNTRGTTSDDPCELHKELYFQEIDSGIVVDKVTETENHSLQKVKIKSKDKYYILILMLWANQRDFENINIGDSISKPAKSFHFRNNNGYEFEVKFKCTYMKD